MTQRQRETVLISRLPGFLTATFLLISSWAAAQGVLPLEVQVQPSQQDGQTTVRISLTPAESPLELPGLPKPAAAQPKPTATPVAPAASMLAVPALPPEQPISLPKPSATTALSVAPAPEEPDPAPPADPPASSPAAPVAPAATQPTPAVAPTPAPAPAAPTTPTLTLAAAPSLPASEAPSSATLSAIPEIASSATLSLAPAASSASDAGAEQLLRQKYQEIQGKVLRGRNDEARRDFLKLASDFPGSAIAPEALFAAAQLEKASVKTRLAEFQALTTRFPGTIWATRSLCQIGQTQYLLGNWSESLKAYRAYRDQHGEEAGKPAMRMDMTKCCLQLRQYEEGLAELERLEADYPNLRSTEQVLDLKSECQMALSRYDEAIYSLQTLLRSYPNFELAPKAVLCLGLCYEQIGRPQDAKPLYTQLIQTYPADRADTPAETRMAQERLAQLDKPLLGGK